MPKNITFVNKAAFDALPKDQQDALVKAATAAEERGWKRSEELSGFYLKELASKGMKVGPPSPTLAAGLKKFGEDLTAGWLKRAGDSGKAIVDAFHK
jgi:TRAP-type C4-dicarboxylate transport system substrate-binding protein